MHMVDLTTENIMKYEEAKRSGCKLLSEYVTVSKFDDYDCNEYVEMED
jgi:hypothetical protein